MKLEINHITKKYGDKIALDDFSLKFTSGVYGILGENGAGKSTLMHLITDNIKRENGNILWNGTDILKLGKQYRKEIGYMPQYQGYYSRFSVIAFLIYIGQLKGLKKKKAMQDSKELLDKLNLKDEMHKKMGELSGGMKQRVMLAQALIGDPNILILDEPTAGLDPKERIRIRNFIAELSDNRIILLATHIVSDIECIADQVLLMKNGKLLKSGTPSELLRSMENHVAEIVCEKNEIERLQQTYPLGTIRQRQDGMVFRIVGDRVEKNFQITNDNLSLEDVYLYYCA